MSAKPAITNGALNADAFPRCNTHRKRLKFFCIKHELLLCSVCAVKRHRGCDDILTVNEACEDKKSEGKKILDIYNQRIALIDNAIVERKAAKKLLDTNAQEIQNEVHDVTQKLIDLVKHEERTILDTLRDMQKKESDALEDDIAGMEHACTKVKNSHDSLSQNLKLSEVDLIHAVMKEKQMAEENSEVDMIVKKRFREVDFKFIISPHVTSFLKHFKVLGQVVMSEESLNSKDISQNSYEITASPSFSRSSTPTSTRHSNTSLSKEEPYMTARERWARDRQMQVQRQPQNEAQFTPERTRTRQLSNPSPNRESGFRNEERRSRMLPRPETPEVYGRPSAHAQRREFIARPMSTPPQENPLQIHSPNERETDHFNYANVYRQVKAEPISFSERSSPAPMASSRIQNFQRDILPNPPAQFFHRHASTGDRSTSPNEDRPPSRAKSPPGPGSPHSPVSVMAVKDEKGNFGRSFAAVQINNGRVFPKSEDDRNPTRPRIMPTSPPARSPVDSGSTNDARYAGAMTYERRPVIRSGTNELTVHLSDDHNHNSLATDEEKVRRWVHKNSFASNGIKSKRLLSGICVLNDGRLIMVDQEHYTVQLFDQMFRFICELKLDSRPFDVVDISDNKIVVSLQSERVLKFVLVTADSLTPVADLCVPCDMVCYGLCRGGGYYCVCCGDEVWILSDEGRVVNRLKTDTSGSPLFVQAEYISTDPNGNVLFVSDSGSNKILAIQVDGKRLWEFTYQGFKPAGLKLVDIYLYVCDRDQHRVLMLNLEGQVVHQSVIGRLDNPRAICFNRAADHLYVTQMRYDAIASPQRPIHVFNFQ